MGSEYRMLKILTIWQLCMHFTAILTSQQNYSTSLCTDLFSLATLQFHLLWILLQRKRENTVKTHKYWHVQSIIRSTFKYRTIWAYSMWYLANYCTGYSNTVQVIRIYKYTQTSFVFDILPKHSLQLLVGSISAYYGQIPYTYIGVYKTQSVLIYEAYVMCVQFVVSTLFP